MRFTGIDTKNEHDALKNKQFKRKMDILLFVNE